MVNWVELVNTHNGWHRDRATRELKVFISRFVNMAMEGDCSTWQSNIILIDKV